MNTLGHSNDNRSTGIDLPVPNADWVVRENAMTVSFRTAEYPGRSGSLVSSITVDLLNSEGISRGGYFTDRPFPLELSIAVSAIAARSFEPQGLKPLLEQIRRTVSLYNERMLDEPEILFRPTFPQGMGTFVLGDSATPHHVTVTRAASSFSEFVQGEDQSRYLSSRESEHERVDLAVQLYSDPAVGVQGIVELTTISKITAESAVRMFSLPGLDQNTDSKARDRAVWEVLETFAAGGRSAVIELLEPPPEPQPDFMFTPAGLSVEHHRSDDPAELTPTERAARGIPEAEFIVGEIELASGTRAILMQTAELLTLVLAPTDPASGEALLFRAHPDPLRKSSSANLERLRAAFGHLENDEVEDAATLLSKAGGSYRYLPETHHRTFEILAEEIEEHFETALEFDNVPDVTMHSVSDCLAGRERLAVSRRDKDRSLELFSTLEIAIGIDGDAAVTLTNFFGGSLRFALPPIDPSDFDALPERVTFLRELLATFAEEGAEFPGPTFYALVNYCEIEGTDSKSRATPPSGNKLMPWPLPVEMIAAYRTIGEIIASISEDCVARGESPFRPAIGTQMIDGVRCFTFKLSGQGCHALKVAVDDGGVRKVELSGPRASWFGSIYDYYTFERPPEDPFSAVDPCSLLRHFTRTSETRRQDPVSKERQPFDQSTVFRYLNGTLHMSFHTSRPGNINNFDHF